ncbi:MAG TPA: hypothetical protein VFR66_00370 [Burkholderiales bacterium]|nr:hypothetical protein [Burkholderiales bacterium]
MSAPGPGKDAPAQASTAKDVSVKDPYIDLAERIFVQLSSRVYGTLASSEIKKPDPKALAAFSFRLAEAFEQASRETDRMKAKIEAASKAAVKLDEVDLSHVFQNTAKK